VPESFDEVILRAGTDCAKYDDRLKRFGRADVLPLWVADMDFPAPECVREALQRLVDHNLYGYHLKSERYFRAITDWWERRHGHTVDPAGIVFSPGVVPALSHLIQALTAKGEGIIVQPPVYHPFAWAVRANERRLLENPLREQAGKYAMDFDDLERKAREARLLILCSPHNPVGRVWRREELERVADICLRHGVTIVSDEIHNDLVYPPHRHVPTASLSPEVARITVTCHAASKTFNLAGLSVAYVMIEGRELREAFRKVSDILHVEAVNPFGLRAMEAAFAHGEPWLKALLEYLEGNYQLVRRYLGEHLPRVTASPLEGTYLAWLDFRRYGFSAQELKDCIIQQAGLALNDGPMFGPGGEGFQRMNIACSRQVLQLALDRLKVALG
jgi:cysteine-S-conjugate beta-lyase